MRITSNADITAVSVGKQDKIAVQAVDQTASNQSEAVQNKKAPTVEQIQQPES